MNILILNWKDIKNPSAGGAELVTFEHAKRWVKSGHKVTWLASSFKDVKKREFVSGIEIIRKGNIYGIYFYAPLFYLFSGQKFDAVIDEVHGIPFFTPLYVRKPILVLIHEVAGDIWDYMYSSPFNYLGKFLEKIYLKLYSRRYFWTDSNSTIDELVSFGINRKKCISIPCPSNAPVSKNIPIKNKKITLVSVSRIVKMKGIEDIIEAFNLIQEKIENSSLLIIGDGEKNYINFLKRELVRKKKIEKKVHFLSFLNEKKKLDVLKKSHLLLHASVKEGWGIVVIEAASQATPAVVYNVPGLNESVKNKKTGIVLSKNSPDEMAKVAIKLIFSKFEYRKYQENCLEWASSLNWNDASNESMRFLKKLTNE